MTDAETAPSCATQFQVKVSQVIVLTSFPFAFSIYCYPKNPLPERGEGIIGKLGENQRTLRG